MKAIILAAGLGTRMKEVGKIIPKCLLKINGKTMLERQFELLNHVGIKKQDIYVVVGSQGDCWNETNYQKIKSIAPNIIVNPKNADLNQTYSFLMGINVLVKEKVLVLDGDLMITTNLIKSLISNQQKTTLLTQMPESENNLGNKVILNESKKIIHVTRQKINLPFSNYAGAFFIAAKDFDSFKNESKKEKYHHEDLGFIFDSLCKTNDFYVVNNEEWININTVSDLENASSVIKS